MGLGLEIGGGRGNMLFFLPFLDYPTPNKQTINTYICMYNSNSGSQIMMDLRLGEYPWLQI